MVRNTVFSHLDSDLPLAFWWRGEFSDSFEERLYSRIDRFIFDGETWKNPRNQLVRLFNATLSGSCHFCYHDLAFTRLNPYRQAIANAFEIPALKHAVGEISEIEIRFAEGNRMSATYLCAWLSHRLGGELDKERSERGRYVFRSNKTGFPPEFVISFVEIEEGNIEAVIKTGIGSIEVSRCPSRDFLRTRFLEEPSSEGSEDWLPLSSKSDAEWVTEILERGGRNRIFPAVIEVAGHMLTV